MERITQRTAATAEESAAAGVELRAQMTENRALVEDLDSLVQCQSGPARAAWRPLEG
jgi:hypothetical protein